MGFYESQLTLLIVITVILLLLERRLSSRESTVSQPKATPDSAASSRDHLDDALENGESPSVLSSDLSDADSDNPLLSSTTGTKNAGRASTVAGARAAALKTLMRKYLTVYAIVMGSSRGFLPFISRNQGWVACSWEWCRCGLASRAVCLFALSRTVWFPGTNCCSPVRDRLCQCGPICPSCGRLGRSIVSTSFLFFVSFISHVRGVYLHGSAKLLELMRYAQRGG